MAAADDDDVERAHAAPLTQQCFTWNRLNAALCSKRTKLPLFVIAGKVYASHTMADPHVISALVDKRARIDGEIKMRRYQIAKLEMELAHIDAVIRMFRPSYDIAKIATKRTFAKNPAGTRKGDISRAALIVLREASEPLSANEIAERVLVKLAKPDSPEARAMLATTIHSTFKRRTDGALRLDATCVPGRWTLARN